MHFKKLAAIMVMVLAIALPGIASAQDASNQTPMITGVEIIDNQVHIMGQDLYLESDGDSEFSLSFSTDLIDGSSATYTFSSTPLEGFGPLVAMYSKSEMALRIGILPSTFTGTVVLNTPRGSTDPISFSIDAPYCPVTAAMVASLAGGDEDNWTATPSNWLFAGPQTNLFVPFVGTLTVPGDNQPTPVFLTQVTTNVAVYDCTEVAKPKPLALN